MKTKENKIETPELEQENDLTIADNGFDFCNQAMKIQENNNSYKPEGDVWKLQMERGHPYSVAILSPHTLNLQTHFVKGSPSCLCSKMYFAVDDPESFCEECLKPGYQMKGLNKPALVMCMVGYVFDLVDAKGKTKTGKEFNHNPLKIIEVRGGKGQVNFGNLNEAIAGEYLVYENGPQPNVWRMRTKDESEGGGMDAPTILSLPDLKRMSSQFKNFVPEHILTTWREKPRMEVMGTIISAYGGLNRPFLESRGFIFPEAKTEASGEEVSESLDT